jgi:carbonic anhydrase/acetyltransferase-like protein (isoleucine patch superfamily)
MIHENVVTDFSPRAIMPQIDSTAFVHPLAAVIGRVSIGKQVLVSPFASVRGDEGQPIFIGDASNVQDGVIIHGLETEHKRDAITENRVQDGDAFYSVFVGRKTTLAHQVQVHGPAHVGDETFVGMQTLIFRATVGSRCIIEPGCIVMGVRIDDNRHVSAGTVLKKQEDADCLPIVGAENPLKDLNQKVVHVNTSLARGYLKNLSGFEGSRGQGSE